MIMAADEFASSRLGDLPNDGYATKRERELSDAVMFFMRDIERNRAALLLIVIEGREVFRGRVLKQWRGLRPADALCDKIYDYFVRQAGPNPLGQLEALSRMTNRERYGLM
jgi:hypothetical protein